MSDIVERWKDELESLGGKPMTTAEHYANNLAGLVVSMRQQVERLQQIVRDLEDESRGLRLRVKKLQTLNDDAESVIVRQREERKRLESELATSQARVGELESEVVANERIARNLENELAALKSSQQAAHEAGQDEPVAVVDSDDINKIGWLKMDTEAGCGTKLYLEAAPTIPEGYVMAKRYYCTKCGGSFTTKMHEGCDYMAIDLAAAPKQEKT